MSFQAYFGKDWPEIKEHYGYYLLPVILGTCALFLLRRLLSRNLNLPPGPTGLPLVGYLPFLGEEPFKLLNELSKKYGNVFSLYLGRTYTVVLGDDQAVKEAWSKATTNYRPPRLFDLIPDGGGIAGANGAEWTEQRRFVLKTMKDVGLGGSAWGRLVEEEVSDFLAVIQSKKGSPVEIEEFLSSSITNNISSLVFGKRLQPGPERDMLNEGMKTLLNVFSNSSIWNFYPSLVDIFVKLKITRFYKIYCELADLNDFMRKQVDLHRKAHIDYSGVDFINEYIEAMRTNQDRKTNFNERNLVANTRTMFIGGSDTTKSSVIWLFLIVAAHRDIQEKVHSEILSVLGKQRRPSWEDHLKMPYTYAVVMEAQRWRTIVPLNVTRMAAEDTKVCGYDIPKGAHIMANNWGLHNDPRYWPEPEKFKPERFLLNEGKSINLKADSYVPFSYGKRKCPGETVAVMATFLYFSSIVQSFEIRVPNGGKPNFKGILGLTYQPEPQELCFVPR